MDKGHFEFLWMPFGLKGDLGIFQRMMNKVLSGLNRLKAFVFTKTHRNFGKA